MTQRLINVETDGVDTTVCGEAVEVWSALTVPIAINFSGFGKIETMKQNGIIISEDVIL